MQDFELASEHFHAAAEMDATEALTNLAAMYLHGMGVPQDVALAHEFVTNPLLAEVPTAKNLLGVMHLKGLGVEQV